MQTHILGYPRLGPAREYKFALERYWRNEISEAELESEGRAIRLRNWQDQAEAGLDWVTVGDFAWFDHILTWSATLGALPARHRLEPEITLQSLFRAARGIDAEGRTTPALQLTKWFDSNYHYLVPELAPDQRFELSWNGLFDEVGEAQAAGHRVKAVIPGPLTYLWLSRTTEHFDRLTLLPRLLPVYQRILERLSEQGVEWVQVDEPALALDLPPDWFQALEPVYHQLQRSGLKLLLSVYYGEVRASLSALATLPVAGFHLDALRGGEQLARFVDLLAPHKVLSLGVVNGRNVWATDQARWTRELRPLRRKLGDRLWLGTSAPLWHVPLDLSRETELPTVRRQRLAFARQKLQELVQLRERVLSDTTGAMAEIQAPLTDSSALQQRIRQLEETDFQRPQACAERFPLQQQRLQLPPLATTTIGSFPQSQEVRSWRRRHRQGELTDSQYDALLAGELEKSIRLQERIGLDVLVHGEAERNDMVEFFGEHLDGVSFTRFGWVQSYGSRCVKPPIIIEDIHRRGPITVDWARRAQTLTDKPVKGMLTGPVTILNWSFAREDIPRADIAYQIALALRDEVQDLEQAGIAIIQIDEPALREGMPLIRSRWPEYLDWAVNAFRLTCAGVAPETQIHTHMCYASFGDILDAIETMDADVITLECSRSQGDLLDMLAEHPYHKGIGPGVFDVHSPAIPDVDTMAGLLHEALKHIPPERLWVNPDCGLKTRQWDEVVPALERMVQAAEAVRGEDVRG